MPAKTVTLSEALDEYETHRRSSGIRATTMRTEMNLLRIFLATNGNMQMRHIHERHLDDYLLERQGKVRPSTWNLELGVLARFFKWAERRRYLSPDGNPAANRRRRKFTPPARLRIPASEFPRLLDAAQHPTDRIVVALGLYLMLRQSEVRLLHYGDVNLVTGEISVTVEKTAQRDVMPISSELDTELRNWFTFYTQQIGRPLNPDDYVAPAKSRHVVHERSEPKINPAKPMTRPHLAVQRALDRAGYVLRDEHGRSKNEGVHTLRRSAARALFDRLVDEGYDGALRTAQAYLHHKNASMTETYLGIDLDVKKRDEMVRGKALFPANADRGNVRELHPKVAEA